MRAAVVGGGAYMVGKSAARRQSEQAQAQDDQNARISDLEQQGAAPAQQADQAGSSSMVDQLNQLAQLHQQGILTDDEFSAAKAKLF
jgi:hypothetical protein